MIDLENELINTKSFNEYLDIINKHTKDFLQDIDQKTFSQSVAFFNKFVITLEDCATNGLIQWDSEKINDIHIFHNPTKIEGHKELQSLSRIQIVENIVGLYDVHATISQDVESPTILFRNFISAVSDGIIGLSSALNILEALPQSKLHEPIKRDSSSLKRVNTIIKQL